MLKFAPIFKLAAIALGLFSFSACSADRVEIDLHTDDIIAAIAGTETRIEFEAEFSVLTEVDDDFRRQVDRIETSLDRYARIEDFSFEESDFGVDISVEGTIPLLYEGNAGKKSSEPWIVLISDTHEAELSQEFPYTVEVITGHAFDRLNDDLQAISFMFGLEIGQPTFVKFRSAKAGKLLLGGVKVDGSVQSLGVFSFDANSRANLSFQGGVWDSTGARFLLAIND